MKKYIGIIICVILLVAICIGGYFALIKKDNKGDNLTNINERQNNTTSQRINIKRNDFNMELKTIKLNNGYNMPIIGLGTWQLTGDTVENSVYWAIKDGYRLIDTAYWYGNEKNVGNAVRKAISEGIVTRDEVFITTKLPPYGFDDYEFIGKYPTADRDVK